MVESPYGFLRGTAVVMAEDVAHLPATGITPVVCGDAHFGNFGFYASPELDLVIDLNDFDEAHPGGWEWDLRRLVASIWVPGATTGRRKTTARRSCVASYRHELRRLADHRCSQGLSFGLTSTGWRRDGRPAQRTGRAVGSSSSPHRRPGVAALHPRGGWRAEDC
jgi:hypothetical protein